MKIYSSQVIILFVMCALTSSAGPQQSSKVAQLGTVSFETSCSPEVKPEFNRAVAWLHSFAYDEAEEGFAKILKEDPQCAVAYWGEAMSIYHPLWMTPSQEVQERGHNLLEQAQKVGAKTTREQDYIHALDVLYAQNDSIPLEKRTQSYATAMEQLSKKYPGDSEAAVFYALSLLTLEPPPDAPLAYREKAIEILEPKLLTMPRHPGVLHYLIHAYDHPRLAEKGLAVARTYAAVAPSAPHALHMPSHIFILRGMWRDAIDSNLAAKAVAQQQGGMFPLHFLDFLSYAYLQVGQESEARQIIEDISKSAPNMMPMMRGHALLLRAELPARFALEMRHWPEAASLEVPAGASPSTQAFVYWARAIGASRSGQVDQAEKALVSLRGLESKQGSASAAMGILGLEASAWVHHVEGRDQEAISELREASEKQETSDTTAHDWFGASAREMLADMLLDLHRPHEALVEYEQAKRFTPGRFDLLYGAARAAQEAGLSAKALEYYQSVLRNTEGSSSMRPEVGEARASIQRLGGGG